MTPNDKLLSLIRTYVPYAVGAVLAWLLAHLALDLSGATETAIIAFTVAVTQNVYYLAVRLLETKFPWVGTLLGITSVPAYTKVDDLWASVIRTGIPTIVGALVVTLASGLFLHLDSDTQTGLIAALTVVVQSGYYTIAAFVERKWAGAKVLLGNIPSPAYVGKHAA